MASSSAVVSSHSGSIVVDSGDEAPVAKKRRKARTTLDAGPPIVFAVIADSEGKHAGMEKTVGPSKVISPGINFNKR